jgi:hypothetical protein
MSEDYEDELVTSHSDENPELNGNERKPLALASNEGSAVSELYTQDRGRKKLLGVRPEEMDHIIQYEDSEGNYWDAT